MNMKNSKKGFTLIELIVVIAIIGVLAAILIPAMLGYVKKSKITTAASSASQLYTAINGALADLEDEGKDVTSITKLAHTRGVASVTVTDETGGSGSSSDYAKPTNDEFYKALQENMNGVKKLDFEANCEGGACTAVACKADNVYTGTKPSVVTKKNYKTYSNALSLALSAAQSKADAD